MGIVLSHIRGVLLLSPWMLHLLFVDIVVSALLPFKALAPDFVYKASSFLAQTVWAWIQHNFERANGASIIISGDKLPRGESAIVTSNHISWSDFYMIQRLAINAGMLGYCRWFAKVQLKWVPFLGWGLWAMGMPMVTRNWVKDQRELDRVFSGIVERNWPIWLISFSEATRFTPAKHAASQRWCEAGGRPQPAHLLYPRTKGFVATVKHLRRAPHVRAVYDVAVAYQRRGRFMRAPSMWETIRTPRLSDGSRGPGYRFEAHVRRFPLEDLPEGEAELAQWLEARWVEKGEWLEGKRREWAIEADGKTE